MKAKAASGRKRDAQIFLDLAPQADAVVHVRFEQAIRCSGLHPLHCRAQYRPCGPARGGRGRWVELITMPMLMPTCTWLPMIENGWLMSARMRLASR